LKEVKFSSPVISPEKIFLAALNYASHRGEQSVKPPSEPYFFTRFRNTLIGDGDPILIPKDSNKVDWEVELAVVIGRTGRYIPKSKAIEYVAGFTVANDISFRDLQFPPGWPQKPNALRQNW
jgi:2-keto-4-pentenoate hydratase/2-oxohepta-3-ene-1,7-dioic acid hydratase in catechol pathway